MGGGGGWGTQTQLRVPTISSLSSKARLRAEVESEIKAHLDTARCVSVSSARARSKKTSSVVGHQRRAMGRLDHAAVKVLVLEHAERADCREHGEYAEVSYRYVSKCRACLSSRHGGLRGAAATLVTLGLCEELGEPLLFSSNAKIYI